MALSLHDALIPNWLQQLGAAAHIARKAESWAGEQGLGEGDILGTRLVGDMLPLAYQFKSCWVHSAQAIERCREGVFSPNIKPPPMTWAGIHEGLADAVATLEALSPDELEAMAGNPMAFVMGDTRLEFTVQDFLLSFSNPNLFFHAATAYDILRMKGMPLGKRDYMGKLRMRPAV